MVAEKVAIVYDWVDKWGGVERVLLALHELFPKAPLFTSYIDQKGALWARNFDVHTSFIQSLPTFIKSHRALSLPFYPYAFESINFNEYDLVISVTSSFAKGIITRPETKHITYLLTPTRFLWTHCQEYGVKGMNLLGELYRKRLREWDYIVAQRPDTIISLSNTVADRCKKYYKRDSQIIYPPFDVEYWNTIQKKIPAADNEDRYYLLVSRLEPYKKVDLAIKVFNKNPDKKLIIVGKGSQEKMLQKMAGQNIKLRNNLSDEQLGMLYKGAQALLMPQEEDFGYVALEAQLFGCPVLAYGQGGATETVLEGKTGLFFSAQTEESLSGALEKFEALSYNLKASTVKLGSKHLEKFSKETFNKEFRRVINY